MSKNKMKQCASCGAEIAASAKTCPKCGAKNKKPIYRRPWFIILIVIIVIGAVIGSQGGNGSSDSQTADTGTGQETAADGAKKEKEITYTSCDAGQMMSALDENAMKASETYKDQYVEVTGKLNVIDSSGNYISIVPTDDEFAIVGIQCNIKNEEQKNAVMEMSVGDTIVVKGKVTDVGEVLGYTLDMDSVSKK